MNCNLWSRRNEAIEVEIFDFNLKIKNFDLKFQVKKRQEELWRTRA